MRPDLLDRLAAEASVVPLRQQQRRAMLVVVVGAALATVLVIGWLGLRRDLAAAAFAPTFWLKLAFPAVLGLLATVALRQSLRPGHRVATPLLALAAMVAGLWTLAVFASMGKTAEQRELLLWGTTWQECPVYITALTLPMLVGALHWVRRARPLSPRVSGALAGLASGAFGAMLYALHCLEPGLPFLGTWYLVGAGIPALLGALVGKRWMADPLH